MGWLIFPVLLSQFLPCLEKELVTIPPAPKQGFQTFELSEANLSAATSTKETPLPWLATSISVTAVWLKF